ncbi:MAG TPA: hypothetical protein VGP03_07535 [Pseudonocardiaceae bacterium]|nr:hypothetical protein [Pseudonocardiaceae bacterium]
MPLQLAGKTFLDGTKDALDFGLSTPHCSAGGQLPAPKLRVPSMDISGDYVLAPAPHLTDPDPLAKAAASL